MKYTIKNIKTEIWREDRIKLTYKKKVYDLKVETINGYIERWEGATKREDVRVQKLGSMAHQEMYEMLSNNISLDPTFLKFKSK